VTHRCGLLLRTIYALCLLGATYNHWVVIYQHGFEWDYGGVARASATFWTALAFIDPAAVLLLFVKPKVGVAATMGIIVVDVIHNLAVVAHYHPPLLETVAASPQVLAQIAFLLFVLATAQVAWGPSHDRVAAG
jgi:hypothetical protein